MSALLPRRMCGRRFRRLGKFPRSTCPSSRLLAKQRATASSSTKVSEFVTHAASLARTPFPPNIQCMLTMISHTVFNFAVGMAIVFLYIEVVLLNLWTVARWGEFSFSFFPFPFLWSRAKRVLARGENDERGTVGWPQHQGWTPERRRSREEQGCHEQSHGHPATAATNRR